MDRINDEEKNGGRGGAAIAIDYGDEGPLGDTLEAIKDHKFVENPLESPGECDLSAHVDFGALRGVVEERTRITRVRSNASVQRRNKSCS